MDLIAWFGTLCVVDSFAWGDRCPGNFVVGAFAVCALDLCAVVGVFVLLYLGWVCYVYSGVSMLLALVCLECVEFWCRDLLWIFGVCDNCWSG